MEDEVKISRRWSLGLLALLAGGAGTKAAAQERSTNSSAPSGKRGGPVSVADFGAIGDGVADDTAAIERARRSGAGALRFPTGRYRVRGIVIDPSDNVNALEFEPGGQILVIAGRNAIGVDIQKPNVTVTGALELISLGSLGDGLEMVGLRHGTPNAGQSYLQVASLLHRNFSGHGVLSWGPVYLQLDRVVGFGSRYGVTFERLTGGKGRGNGATVAMIGSSYHTGCTRGIYANGAGWIELRNAVFEYCGATGGGNDAALHLVKSSGVFSNLYGEENYRNFYSEDSSIQWLGGTMLAAKKPDIQKYANMDHALRGNVVTQGNRLSARYIGPDKLGGFDLQMGDITVPVGGGATRLGLISSETIRGQARSGQWTNVKTLEGQTGSGDHRMTYHYAIYAGLADLTTGYDSGAIFNGQIYSHSGRNPEWLRLTGNTLEIRISSRQYGLQYGCHLEVINQIGS